MLTRSTLERMVRTLNLMDRVSTSPLTVTCTPESVVGLSLGRISSLDLSGVHIGNSEAEALRNGLGGEGSLCPAMLKKLYFDGKSSLIFITKTVSMYDLHYSTNHKRTHK